LADLDDFFFIFQETEYPYYSRIVKLDAEWWDTGEKKTLEAYQKYIKHHNKIEIESPALQTAEVKRLGYMTPRNSVGKSYKKGGKMSKFDVELKKRYRNYQKRVDKMQYDIVEAIKEGDDLEDMLEELTEFVNEANDLMIIRNLYRLKKQCEEETK
jgi:hypothetical protein